MEQHDPSRRQYAPNTYAAQQSQHGSNPMSGQFASPNPSERFRQSTYLQQSPVAASPTGRPSNDAQHAYHFAHAPQYGAASALQSSSMQYAQEMQAQEAQRQQQQQQYSTYGANVMYNMAQPRSQQQPSQSDYERMSQYRQRPSTASETMVTQFGVPQNAQYYVAPGQTGSTGGSVPELSAHPIPSQYQHSSYPQPGSAASQAYPGAMIDQAQAATYGYAQQPQYNGQQQSQSADPGFNDYQARIRSIFTVVREGTLSDIAAPLLHVSQYLLGNAEHLGLTRDDDTLHDDRIRLWDEFNRAWLVTLQRQLDLTEQMMRQNQPLREPQSIMSSQSLENLSRELVRLCDGVERHGLVDYQMGVAEEEIMDLLLRCLSLLDPTIERTRDAGPQADSSGAASSRAR